MSKNYYYLVAGLPDLLIENKKVNLDYRRYLAELADDLEPSDAIQLRVLRHPVDNQNLIALLEKRIADFSLKGNYSLGTWKKINLPD